MLRIYFFVLTIIILLIVILNVNIVIVKLLPIVLPNIFLNNNL
jgi:hypothetical protein